MAGLLFKLCFKAKKYKKPTFMLYLVRKKLVTHVRSGYIHTKDNTSGQGVALVIKRVLIDHILY